MVDTQLRHYRRSSLPLPVAGGELSPDPANLTAILADISGSMCGEPIAELNHGLTQYQNDIRNDPVLAGTTLTSMFVFDDDVGARQLTPFAAPAYFDPPTLQASGGTPLCRATIKTIEGLTQCSALMRGQFDRDCRVSWLFVLSDGFAGDRDLAAAAQMAVRKTAVENDIHVFFIACGESVDMDFLHYLAQPKRKPRRMRSIENFADFFRWLHESQVEKSQSQRDDLVRLPPTRISVNPHSGWEDDSWTSNG
jgi:uncharacterized protein YegL